MISPLEQSRIRLRSAEDQAATAVLLWRAWVRIYGQHGGDPDLSTRFRARRVDAKRRARLANRAHAALLAKRRAVLRALARAAFRTSALAEVWTEIAAERAAVKAGAE